MSQACKKMNLRFKLDLRLLVWKEESALFDGSTGEVAKMATQSKLVSDKQVWVSYQMSSERFLKSSNVSS